MFNKDRRRTSDMMNNMPTNRLARRSNRSRKRKTENIARTESHAPNRKFVSCKFTATKSFDQDRSETVGEPFQAQANSWQCNRLVDRQISHSANCSLHQPSHRQYDSITDYYVKINSQHKYKNDTVDNADDCLCFDETEPFCAALRHQLSSATLNDRKSRSLKRVKALVSDINAILDGNRPFFPSHAECNKSKIEKKERPQNSCLLPNHSWSYKTPIANRALTINDCNSSLTNLLENGYNLQVKISSPLFTASKYVQVTPFSPLQLVKLYNDDSSIGLPLKKQNWNGVPLAEFKKEKENVNTNFKITGQKLLRDCLKLDEKSPLPFFDCHVNSIPKTIDSQPFLSAMPVINDPSPLKYYPRKD